MRIEHASTPLGRILTCLMNLYLLSATTVTAVRAQTFQLTPLDFGDGIRVSGTVQTDGTQGVLTGSNFTHWDITVTMVNEFSYTRANTRPNLSLVASNGSRLTLPTSPDGVTDGGVLSFLSGRRFGVQVADFSGSNAATGGQAFYVNGSDFGFLPLHRPNNSLYVAARSSGNNLFELSSLDFGSGITLSGTITTDGATGLLTAADLVDWNLTVREVSTLARFDETNSRVLASDLVSTDGRTIQVANAIPDTAPMPGTPGGQLAFGTLSRIDPFGVQLADFSDPALLGGQATFFTSAIYQVLSPLSFESSYIAASAVPEPGCLVLTSASLALTGLAFARRRLPWHSRR